MTVKNLARLYCSVYGTCATLDGAEQCDDANNAPYDGCSPHCLIELYPPPAWSCVLSYYDAGDGCDCGCGVVDPDCADATVASCAFCRPNGSCGNGACPSNIDPIDNAACL
jgi:cysteine-rich repeat protein